MEVKDDTPQSPKNIWGFMKGQITVPDDFDDRDADVIEAMFVGENNEDSVAQEKTA